MAALRRRSALIDRAAAVPRHDAALVLAPVRPARHSHHVPEGYGFTSTTNLTVISGSDSTYSTMATRTDIPGTGRVIDKFVFQPAGRRLEAFIGGIVRRMSTRKVRRRESAALLAEDLALPAREDVAPPYTTRRGRRPLPRVPEMAEVHPNVTPWLAQTGAFRYEHSEQSYNASDAFDPPPPPVIVPPFQYGQEGNDESMRTTQTTEFAVDLPSEVQWLQQRNETPQAIVVAPPAYERFSEPRVVMPGIPPIPPMVPPLVMPINSEPIVIYPTEPTSSASISAARTEATENSLMTFCMDDELVYAPMEADHEKALTLAQSFFPALASVPRERIAFSLHLENESTPDALAVAAADSSDGLSPLSPSSSPSSLSLSSSSSPPPSTSPSKSSSSSPTGAVRVLPAAWQHLCQTREEIGLVHITVLPEISSAGSASAGKGLPYYYAAEGQQRFVGKLLRYAYEGEIVCVLSSPDYELATTTAQTAFPALARVGRECIVLSVKKRLADGTMKSIRVPREAWPCLSPRLQDSEVVEVSLLARATFS